MIKLPARENEITRVEAFSDGMIAFAATLLVVTLDPPRTYDELVNNLYGFVPFGLSFGALFYIWFVHTVLFRRYPLKDTPSIFINGMLLFTVLFYVHPLKFLSSSFVSLFSGNPSGAGTSWNQLQTMFIIYACGWIVIFGLVAWLYRRAWVTRDSLGLTPVQAYDAITYSRHYLGFVASGILSILVALTGFGVGIGTPGMIYVTIGLFAWLNARNREPGRQALARKIAEHPQLADTMAISAATIRDALR